MSFTDAIGTLNTLKRRKIIRDYALIGAVAATAYMEPIFTEDLNIIILVDTDGEYLSTFRQVGEFSESMEGMHYILGGVPVQMFPSTTKPLFRDAVEKAKLARVGNRRVKVALPEHLILLYLEAFRDKDHFRIHRLLPLVSTKRLQELLGRFDDEGRLTSRLQTIL